MGLWVQEMKTLDKEVRVWDVYAGLESTVKNLLTSLRAVNELQNSAVRERHWQQLMHTTRVKYLAQNTVGRLHQHRGNVMHRLITQHVITTCITF